MNLKDIDQMDIDRSALTLDIWNSKFGSLWLMAWDSNEKSLGCRRWELTTTAQIIRAYWLVRTLTRISKWNRTLPYYKHCKLQWQYFRKGRIDES